MRRLSPPDVLARLAANPRSVFSPAAIDAKNMALLRPLAVFQPEPQEGDSIDCPTGTGGGCMRVLGMVRGELMAICPCEANEAPLTASRLDLTTFQIDVDHLARTLATAFGVAGTTASVTDRCWYLGQETYAGRQVALVLGLFDDRDAARELRALPGALPEAVDDVVCLAPAYVPPPDIERSLAAIRVRTLRLERFDSQGSLADLLRAPSRTAPLVILTDSQELEFAAAGFRCRWPIVVDGRAAKGGANVVEVAGSECRFGPATFRLFMRLLAASFETANGYLPVGQLRGGGGLAAEGYYSSEGAYQAHNRLRDALGTNYRELLEVGGGMIRLSTHRGFVRVESDKLARHRDPRVQDLAARIAARAS